jgi:hypothetical protein
VAVADTQAENPTKAVGFSVRGVAKATIPKHSAPLRDSGALAPPPPTTPHQQDSFATAKESRRITTSFLDLDREPVEPITPEPPRRDYTIRLMLIETIRFV